MIGRCRVWTEGEVAAWIERQPTKNTAPLKGIAKKARAEAVARQRRNDGAAASKIEAA
jgi:hypothetical protein